jgi:catechol 2,3-dioxygenase-like lactoylglutathione lyase family enzyme
MNHRPVSFVQVQDRAEGVAWYRDVLGLAHRSADDFGDEFAFGQGTLRLTALPDWTPHAHPTVGFEVDDIRAAVAELRGRGATFEIYDGYGQDADGIWTAPGGAASVAWFKDCAGNLLSLSARG